MYTLLHVLNLYPLVHVHLYMHVHCLIIVCLTVWFTFALSSGKAERASSEETKQSSQETKSQETYVFANSRE